MTSVTLGKEVSFEVCTGLCSIEYIYMLPHIDAVILKFECLPTNKLDSSIMITISHICCTGIFTSGEILHTIFVMYNWFSCITFKFFNPDSQRWYCLICHLLLFFRIQEQHSHCSHHHIVHCLRAQLIPT
jgi:hypothetical protein